MKRILITGANSYIGTSFERWIAQWPEQYAVETVSTLNEEWQEKNFEGYDAVLHVAAIVHRKEKRGMNHLYQSINCDLTVAIARKAKQAGVKQFIFLSTMAIYGMINEMITQDTIPNPKTMYAKSKWEAEQKLCEMQEPGILNIVIIRPSLVYGENCPGNYIKLEKLAIKTPVFPKINNQRSMIYIDNLCQFIKLLIDEQTAGIFHPQNREYVNVSEMVSIIAELHGKRMWLTSLFNPLIKVMSKKIDTASKVFGNLVYEKAISDHDNFKYCMFDLRESVEITESNVLRDNV